MSASRSRARTAGFAVVAVLLGLALLEGAARLALPAVAPPPSAGLDARDPPWLVAAKSAFDTGFFVPDDDVLWLPTPNFRYQPFGKGVYGDEPFQLNQWGHRSPPIDKAKPPGVKRVLVLGGSHPFGMYADQSHIYSTALQRMLDERARGAWQVINAASPGHTTFQGLQYLLHRGLEFSPDVVVFDLGMNDGLPLSIDFARPDHEVQAVPKWAKGAGSTAAGLATYQVLKALVGSAQAPSDARVRVPPDRRDANLRRVAELGEEHDFEVLYMSQVRVDRWKGPGNASCDFTAEEFSPRVDVCGVFRALGPEAGREFADPIHATNDGHERIARAVLARMDELGWLTPAPRR